MPTEPISKLLEVLDSCCSRMKKLVKAAYRQGFEEGRAVERLLPDWRPVSVKPEEGQKIIVCLNCGTVEMYTYRTASRNLMQLMDKHVRCWLPAPAPPLVEPTEKPYKYHE